MGKLEGLAASFGQGIGDVGSSFVYYMTWFIIAIAILGAIYFLYIFIQYKYKAFVFIPRGTGYIIKKIRIRERVKKGVRKWNFFMKKTTMAPLEDKYILPGNLIFLRKVGDGFIPGNISMVGNPEMNIDFIPQDIKFWLMNGLQEDGKEYQTFKEKYAPLVFGIMVVIFVLIFAGVSIYFIVKSGGMQANSIIDAYKGGPNLAAVAQSIKPG